MSREPKSAESFVCTLDLQGRFTSIDPAGEAISGYSSAELLGRFATELIAPEFRDDAIERFAQRLAGDTGAGTESVLLRRDGAHVPISVSSILIEHEGVATGVLGIVHDLSERNRASDALSVSDQRFRGAFDSASIGMALVAPDGRFLEVNQAFCDLLGYDAGGMVSHTFQELTHPDDLELDLDYVRRVLAGELRTYQMEKRYIHANGTEVWALLSVSLVRSADGTPLHFVAQAQDIDVRKRAVDALERREAQLLEAQQLAKLGSWEYRFGTDTVAMSKELLSIYGLGPGTHVTPELLQERVHPDDRAAVDEAGERTPLPGEFDEIEFRVVLPGGAGRWVYSRSEAIVENGVVVGKRGIAQDISDRKEAEQRFLTAERRYRTLVEQLPLAMYIRPLDMEQPNIYVSPQVEPMLGYPVDAWLGDPGLLASIVHPEDRARVIAEGTRVRAGGAPVHDEYRYLKPDGSIVWVQDETHLVLDEHGAPLYVQGFLQDITERRLTEAERDRLREELLHAQKLEAIGRLAGGVAHDFNNMLTAIRGYAELLVAKLDPSTSARDDATRILRAAEQAADLPRQLLAFGRKQVLEPTVVDVNDVVASIGGLLEHVISGSITVEIEARAEAPWTFADRSQLEQALVNLALNASDAMPVGGRLKVTTANVTIGESEAVEPDARPGSYTVIRVSDTGVGMDDETRRRAFEPFFTTKLDADGSGLGLSSVYGTVAQSGGFVLLETTLGEGSTFSLHLPTAAAPAAAGPQTILLAEDEEIVRDLTEQILANAGYGVLAAGDGTEALTLYHKHQNEIAAVVTDIVMPHLSGRGLARQIRNRDAELPIVFISGHHDETSETLQLGSAAALLQKPFSQAALVEAIGQLVGGRRPSAAPVERERVLTCVVADDHPAVLDSVSRFLESRQIRVAQARDGEEALATIASVLPDVAVVDVAMTPLSGIDVARRLRETSPDTPVVLYTGHNDRALLDQALDAGARGFVLKEAALTSLEEAVRTVAQGGTWVDPGLASTIASPTTVLSLPPLTPREREILGLVADGLTNDKVAAMLAISPETVQSHVRNAMVKLEADSRTEAVATALRHSLIA
ncbi:MAG: PAS domain S-box protein [Gaiellaceae bacterium]